MQAIPDSATLLLDKSMLPTNNKELSVDGILLLSKIGEEGAPSEDPNVAHQRVLDSQRRDLEEMLNCYDGILSAGQMGQYQAVLSETRGILEKIPKTRAESRAAAVDPEPPAIEITPIPDDDEDVNPKEAEDQESVEVPEE